MSGSSSDKVKAVDAAIGQIERQFGKGSIMKLGSKEVMAIPTISTELVAIGDSYSLSANTWAVFVYSPSVALSLKTVV